MARVVTRLADSRPVWQVDHDTAIRPLLEPLGIVLPESGTTVQLDQNPKPVFVPHSVQTKRADDALD
jgi:hypothetical protein